MRSVEPCQEFTELPYLDQRRARVSMKIVLGQGAQLHELGANGLQKLKIACSSFAHH